MPSHPDKPTRDLNPDTLLPRLSKTVRFLQGQKADAKTESAFFTKLPPEVRQLVYTYLLGGANVHIVQSGHRLVSKRQSRPCYQFPWFFLDQRWVIHWEPLSFLMTCRQAYSESIDVLYSTTIFMFGSPRTFNLFASSIPSPSRNAIRRLHIDYYVDGERTYGIGAGIWQRCCDTIAEMPSVEEVYIWLIKDDTLVPVTDSNIIDPMRVIDGVRDFRVDLVGTVDYDWAMCHFRGGQTAVLL